MTYNPYSLEMITPFTFTVFYPEGMLEAINGVSLKDGVTLSGQVRVYAHAAGYWPTPETHICLDGQPDSPQMPRLCVDRRSPLLCWDDFFWIEGSGFFMNPRPIYSDRFVYWDMDTRYYPNGLHALTVASWLWFHTGEGSGTTIEVFFSNPETELIAPAPPVWNPNVPALLPKENAGLSPWRRWLDRWTR